MKNWICYLGNKIMPDSHWMTSKIAPSLFWQTPRGGPRYLASKKTISHYSSWAPLSSSAYIVTTLEKPSSKSSSGIVLPQIGVQRSNQRSYPHTTYGSLHYHYWCGWSQKSKKYRYHIGGLASGQHKMEKKISAAYIWTHIIKWTFSWKRVTILTSVTFRRSKMDSFWSNISRRQFRILLLHQFSPTTLNTKNIKVRGRCKRKKGNISQFCQIPTLSPGMAKIGNDAPKTFTWQRVMILWKIVLNFVASSVFTNNVRYE